MPYMDVLATGPFYDLIHGRKKDGIIIIGAGRPLRVDRGVRVVGVERCRVALLVIGQACIKFRIFAPWNPVDIIRRSNLRYEFNKVLFAKCGYFLLLRFCPDQIFLVFERLKPCVVLEYKTSYSPENHHI